MNYFMGTAPEHKHDITFDLSRVNKNLLFSFADLNIISYMAYTLTTKWGSFKYQKPIALVIASMLFLSGVSLLNGNIPVLILYYFFGSQGDCFCNSPWYITAFGFLVVLLSLFIFYLLIINWRKEVYLKLFYEVQLAVNAFFTGLTMRLNTVDTQVLEQHHTEAHAAYLQALKFVYENATLLDDETDKDCTKLLHAIGLKIIDFKTHIKGIESNSPGKLNYDPHQANSGLAAEMEHIRDLYKKIKSDLRRKNRYKL
ncbi:hypothetical protein IDJ77_03930 [Mucilaginibacter sp. ZT4R22]|uniref:Uncharacterized protein n=1 Tax=Mucilaginibacter pankratovii TaxID=2772110 RepID=A0ABR7WKV0_9SPHI|nr:hypothetical protein [Mucilaginibacter pankratovii]MBD1362950.1 hypothetical protein [Mucilaginibacter pankratovii]